MPFVWITQDLESYQFSKILYYLTLKKMAIVIYLFFVQETECAILHSPHHRAEHLNTLKTVVVFLAITVYTFVGMLVSDRKSA